MLTGPAASSLSSFRLCYRLSTDHTTRLARFYEAPLLR